MSPPKFEYAAPKTVAEAISLRKEGGMFLAGGTDLLVAVKQKICLPELLIDLNAIFKMKGIKWDKKKGLRIGALTTLSQLKEDSIVQEHIPILSQIISVVSTPQLRNMGTIGGNLCLDTRCYYFNQPFLLKKRWKPCFKMGGKTCHVVKGETCYAVYSGDMSVPFIALGAKVKVEGPKHRKDIELQNFFTGSGIKANVLKMKEIVTEIVIPRMPKLSGLSYQKLRLRDTIDFPLAGVAVFLNLDERNGRCRNIRIVLGAVGPSPIIVEDASKFMQGKEIDPETVEEVSGIAQKRAHPVDNTASSPRYRRDMVRVLTKNAINEALEIAKKS